MAHCWKDTDRGRPKYLEKYQYQCYFAHHKSHMNWPKIELIICDEKAVSNCVSNEVHLNQT
jgi:hypothetical protein